MESTTTNRKAATACLAVEFRISSWIWSLFKIVLVRRECGMMRNEFGNYSIMSRNWTWKFLKSSIYPVMFEK